MNQHHLVIGYGEIGQAVAEAIGEYQHVSYLDTNGEQSRIPEEIHILHICFPPSDNFIFDVQDYINEYGPILTIIWSSVPIGTTTKLGTGVIHSPVEGVHPNLSDSIRAMDRYVGYNTETDAELAQQLFTDMDIKVKLIPDPRVTEFLKLRSTSKYGINLVWTQYEANVMKTMMADYKYVQEYDQSYNRLYEALEMPQHRRYIMYPPDNHIGGHCVVPNAKLLNEQFPNDMLKMIEEME